MPQRVRIKKKYHFYAAHRNETLKDKCSNIHGHTYFVTVELTAFKNAQSGVSILFADIDKHIEPIIAKYDHAMLINMAGDTLFEYLKLFERETKEKLKMVTFHEPTSVENLAAHLWRDIVATGLPISRIKIKETNSSTVVYEG